MSTSPFRGEPVVNGVSINANFAGKAHDGIRRINGNHYRRGCRTATWYTGAIPHRGLGRQIISGVTRGSFGFEIELPPPTEDERGRGQTDNPAEKAVEMIQDLLETSLAGTDEELATLTDQMHPRGGQESGRVPENTEKQPGPR